MASSSAITLCAAKAADHRKRDHQSDCRQRYSKALGDNDQKRSQAQEVANRHKNLENRAAGSENVDAKTC